MLGDFAIGSIAAALLVGGWYVWFRRISYRRSIQIVGWIERALSDRKAIRSVRWDTDSRFRVELGLLPAVFRRASIAVQLEPREMPFNWMLNRLQGEGETVTFEAELDHSPAFNLSVQSQRWQARTWRIRPKSHRHWQYESMGPMVISTHSDPQEKFGGVLDLLLAARAGNFTYVTFRRTAPQFVACAPLTSLRPDASHSGMFEVLRELAASASTSMQ